MALQTTMDAYLAPHVCCKEVGCAFELSRDALQEGSVGALFKRENSSLGC